MLKNGQIRKAGGFIWHTTGSGKTLTSFKAKAIGYTKLDFIKIKYYFCGGSQRFRLSDHERIPTFLTG
ncbi:MAG: hypothetical protein KF870_11265 [Leadbetterella sp.]|nr:hypothetical protein [Leadbetterella sp.]